MTALDRQTALERLYVAALNMYKQYRDAPRDIVMQLRDALIAVEEAALEGELKERMEWWRARWEKECADLADARAAIREAGILLRHAYGPVESAKPWTEYDLWLALPAVVAAGKEEKR